MGDVLTEAVFEELGGKHQFYPTYLEDTGNGTIDSIPLFDKAIFRVNITTIRYKDTGVVFPIGNYEHVYWNGENDLFYRERLLKIGDKSRFEKYVVHKYGNDVISRFLVEEKEFFSSRKRIGEVPERHKNRKQLTDEFYIDRLLKYTFLRYYPVKEVVNAIVYSDYEPSEINGQNGSIFDIVLYLRYKGVKPSREGEEEYDIKRMLAWDERGMIETVKNHWSEVE